MSNDEWLNDEEIIERWEQQDKERAAKASRSADGAGGAVTSGQSIGEKTLRIEPGELVRAAEELRDIMAASGQFYERGTRLHRQPQRRQASVRFGTHKKFRCAC